jgi:hypothetical protein
MSLLDGVRRSPGDRRARAELRLLMKQERARNGIVHARGLPDYDGVTARLGAYPYAVLRQRIYQPKIAALLAPAPRRLAATLDPVDALADALPRRALAGLSALDATQYVGIKTDLPNYILNNLGDRQEMAHSVEGRVPFLDHKVTRRSHELGRKGARRRQQVHPAPNHARCGV